MKGILKAAHKLFQYSPARRSDYLHVNDIDDEEGDTNAAEFPKPFCDHRWLENGPVLSRLLSLLEKLRNYIAYNNQQPKSRRVASGSYLKLEEEVKTDGSLNLCSAKL